MDAEQLSGHKTREQAADAERSHSNWHNCKRTAMHWMELDEAQADQRQVKQPLSAEDK
jgi:hypothetical protein